MPTEVIPPAHLEYLPDRGEVVCKGDWTIEGIKQIEKNFNLLIKKLKANVVLNGENIEKIDSAGAILLFDLLNQMKKAGKPATASRFRPDGQSLLSMVKEHEEIVLQKLKKQKIPSWLYLTGKWVCDKSVEMLQFIAFVGEFTTTFYNVLRRPSHIAWKAVLVVIEEMGYQALPIVGLLTFLVGVIVTYQIAQELSPYGASSYIVDVTGMIIFREFGPLITAIIAAGRTSTAFTSQIGTMKVNEELDALATLGVPPYERLVLPKFIGLLIALPLLTVWANVFGILGAMLTSKVELGVGYIAFIERFQYQIEVKHYFVGLVKVPVFAMIVALVGCFQGFQVEQSADSVGRKTTKSAVQSIFLIIVADAIFTIVFNIRGI
ncbi:MAG: ABC transporter permease [Coxiella sp. RIFCSPHIGHO2_12_FULL_44_14]|nr:MAG: ABC transporter permease [Coxiella sp. RIFCSPHIGHO2_12_FULL_44_14]